MDFVVCLISGDFVLDLIILFIHSIFIFYFLILSGVSLRNSLIWMKWWYPFEELWFDWS